MKHIKGPQTSIPLLLLLSGLSGTSLAATDIQEPCPEAGAATDALHAFIANDRSVSPVAQPVDALDHTSSALDSIEVKSDTESEPTEDTAEPESAPAYTTRFPGVSVNDLPQFRRHMYRTDI